MRVSQGQFEAITAGMPEALASRLLADARTVRAQAGRTLVSLGAGSTQVYIILEGRAQAKLFSIAGREVILRDLPAGTLFGELAAIDGRPRSASIVALTDCTLAGIDAAGFRAALAELPVAATWIAERLTAQVRELTEKVFELNALQVRNRLHCELLRLCRTAAADQGSVTLDPSPTHADLASRVGTHREAVTRELSFLIKHGIVAQGRRRITVRDVPALVELVRNAGGDISIGL